MPTAPSRGRTRRPKATVTELRARIRALEKPGEQGRAFRASGDPAAGPPEVSEGLPPIVPLGVPAIDAHLPDGGLRLAGLHEIAGAREEWDDAVAAGFCLTLLGRLAAGRGAAGGGGGPVARGPVLWAARRADLYGPGVAGLMGVHPGRLILVRARRDAEVLWALEEGLRAPGAVLSAAVGELGEADDIALRRLQLAAEAAGRPCFLLRRRLYGGGAAMPAIALTRWRVGALPSSEPGVSKERAGLPGRSRWRVDLLRCRGAAPGTFTVEWDDAAGDFALAAPVRDRPVAPGAATPSRRAG